MDKTSRKVLVVDDSTAFAGAIGLMLRFKGHTVKTAGNGKEALLALEKEKFDLAIIDLMMPTMDGCELLSKIKKDNGLKDIHAVILSEENRTELKAKVLALGASRFFVKPFKPKDFIDAMEKMLNEEPF